MEGRRRRGAPFDVAALEELHRRLPKEADLVVNCLPLPWVLDGVKVHCPLNKWEEERGAEAMPPQRGGERGPQEGDRRKAVKEREKAMVEDKE